MFLSSRYMPIPANTCSNFGYFPLQFFYGYNNTTQDQGNISQILNNHPQILYALAMPSINEGRGIVLEDAKSGLAGNNVSGIPGGLSELYIYERDGQGSINNVPWSPIQRKQLPINYM